MSEEDKQFLTDALKSMTLDVIEELTKAMRTLAEGNASEDDQVQSLEVVTNFVADIDTANGENFSVKFMNVVKILQKFENFY